MSRLSKLKNTLFYIFIVLGLMTIFSQLKEENNINLPIRLGYVYSGSMEPTIKTNHGYILIKSKEYGINDIITFLPKVLKDKYVTHRIVDLAGDGKFITRGDNNQSTDQEGGEPLITEEQIIGKALMINSKPIIIPYLGIITKKFNSLIKGLNVFMLISIGIGLYLLGYILETTTNKYKGSRKRHIRIMDIAPYFDPVFILLSAIVFINIIFLGLTIKSWTPEEISYVIVSKKGLSSPIPGERFIESMNLENKTWLSFVTFFEPEREGTVVHPKGLLLPPKQNQEYTLSIKAPDKIGYYTEKIYKRTYINILPEKLLEFLYSKGQLLPLMVLFTPGIMINIGVYIWWMKRWKLGRRKAMEWLIPFRGVLKKLI